MCGSEYIRQMALGDHCRKEKKRKEKKRKEKKRMSITFTERQSFVKFSFHAL